MALHLRDSLRLFQTMLERGDLWSLGNASSVCRTWRRVASLVAARHTTALRFAEPSAQDIAALTKLAESRSWDDHEGFVPNAEALSLRECTPGAPFATSVTPADDAVCNRALGALLGRGSFARVYTLASAPDALTNTYHLTSPAPAPLATLCEFYTAAGHVLLRVPFDKWLAHVQAEAARRGDRFPLSALLSYFARGFPSAFQVSCQRTMAALARFGGLTFPDISEEVIARYAQFYVDEGLVHFEEPPQRP